MIKKTHPSSVTNPKYAAAKAKVSFEAVSLLVILELWGVMEDNFDLLVIHELGNAMLEGACKYGRHNYRDAGGKTSTYIPATFRHILAYLRGEYIDKASGVPHITKAIASLCTTRDLELFGKLEDDRPPPLPQPELNMLVRQLEARLARNHSRLEAEKGKDWYIKNGARLLAQEAFFHLAVYWEGQHTNLDTGNSRLVESLAALWTIRSLEIQGKFADTCVSEVSPERFEMYFEALTKQLRGIQEKYPDPQPPHTRSRIGKRPRKPAEEEEIYYVSCKVTNGDQEKLKASLTVFHSAARRLRAEGKKVFNPAEHEREGWTWEMYLGHFIEWIRKHRPVMYMLCGWKDSLGARLEHELAKLLGLRIIYEEN